MTSTPRQLTQHGWNLAACLALSLGLATRAQANDPAPATPAKTAATGNKVTPPAAAASESKTATEEVREAVQNAGAGKKQLTLVFDGKEKKLIAVPAKPTPTPAAAPSRAADKGQSSSVTARLASAPPPAPIAKPVTGPAGSLPNPADSRRYIRAKAAALAGHGTESAGAAAHAAGDVHWSYGGEAGPQAWGQLKPEFNVCAIGKRQSPINIEESATLQGPAEPLQFNYLPSSGTVVNNGHTIQVDLFGDNSVTVRDSTFKLIQFHFHHPSEERVNYKGFSMVAHLVHKNLEGQLAVVAVLLDPGAANALIDKVWTHMPLDAGDRVRLPTGLIDMNELLPKDQRYYQFMGSLTTPPCTEGVLWMVLKQPATVSPAQIKLFSQLFPNNARPVQAVNGRPVRDAQ